MGYTHYWTLQRPITAEEVAAVGNDIRDIILASELPIAYEYDRPDAEPQLDAEVIHYNGVGDDGHETFYIAAGDSAFSVGEGEPGPPVLGLTVRCQAYVVAETVFQREQRRGDDDIVGLVRGLAERATGRFMPTPADALGLEVEA